MIRGFHPTSLHFSSCSLFRFVECIKSECIYLLFHTSPPYTYFPLSVIRSFCLQVNRYNLDHCILYFPTDLPRWRPQQQLPEWIRLAANTGGLSAHVPLSTGPRRPCTPHWCTAAEAWLAGKWAACRGQQPQWHKQCSGCWAKSPLPFGCDAGQGLQWSPGLAGEDRGVAAGMDPDVPFPNSRPGVGLCLPALREANESSRNPQNRWSHNQVWKE